MLHARTPLAPRPSEPGLRLVVPRPEPLRGHVILAVSLPESLGAVDPSAVDSVASWLAYARWRLGQVYPEVAVTSAPVAKNEIVADDPSTRAELRERVSDAWADWCAGARDPEWVIRAVLDDVCLVGGDEALLAVANGEHEPSLPDAARDTLLEEHTTAEAAQAAVRRAARARCVAPSTLEKA